MKKSTIASLISLIFATPVFAAENINLNDVVVTASRLPQMRESVVGDVSVIDAEEIKRAGPASFMELLRTQPGVEISSSGGPGKESSIYLRGANSNQILVLIDGVRVGSATTGATTFENIPLAQIERVEILRGPATSLYGQDAVGGVIQIFTKKGHGKPQIYAAVGYGTYDTKTAEAGVRGGLEDTKYSLSVSSSTTDSFSAKRIRSGIESDNDNYRNLAFTSTVSHQIMQGHEIGIQFLSSEGHSNYDGSTTYAANVDLSQQSYGLFSNNQFTSNWKSSFLISEGIDDNKSKDDQYDFILGANKLVESRFKTKQKQLTWQNDIEIPLGTMTLLYDRLEQRVISDTPYDKTKRDTDGFMIGYLGSVENHSLQASLRNSHSDQFGTNTTGNIGYGYQFNPNWRATGNYGTAFKAPTFNDLYYAYDFGGIIYPFNNPDLKEEKSRNVEASLRYESDSRDASLTVYNNEINDFITLDSNFLPTNVDAKLKGITLAGSQSWSEWLLKGNIDIQSPENLENDNLLARRANRHGSLNLSREWNNWHFSSEVIASSVRYNDPDNQFPLTGYAILNLIADYKINQDWTLRGRANNVLDKEYALASTASVFDPNGPAYNMPGSNLFVSIRWEPK